PEGWSTTGQKSLIALPGELIDTDEPTLSFSVPSSFRPVGAPNDWQGFSGSTILHSTVRDPGDIWIYGVAQYVPPRFPDQLGVARLAKAIENDEFCKLLADAGVTHAEPADPDFFPPAEEFPDIERLRSFARARLTATDVFLLETAARFCANVGEIEQIHRGGTVAGPRLAPADLLHEL